jgi:hypothetical protein
MATMPVAGGEPELANLLTQLTRCHCPGCFYHPLTECVICGQAAVIVSEALGEGVAHSMSFCGRHWREVQALRREAARNGGQVVPVEHWTFAAYLEAHKPPARRRKKPTRAA